MEDKGAGWLWATAAAVAALGTWICFDAMPGINWFLWTAAATAGLVSLVSRQSSQRNVVMVLAVIAVIAAGGAAITADEVMNFFTFLFILLLLAMAMLISAGGSSSRITAAFTIAAPIAAFGNAFISAISRSGEAIEHVRSDRARAGLRGVVITVPVLIVFALLLSTADPVFARWRDAIDHLITSWDFLPRTIFFIALLTIVIGAYGYAAANREVPTPTGGTSPPRQWLGSLERLILLGSVAGLLWLFLAIQVSYLFGNLPRVEGSGITFAEYARRGFGELTIVAAASALLIIASERLGARNGRERTIRTLTFALIVAVLFLLGSAFRRVLLYEAAYGFTTARLYAQAFMLVIAAGLLFLAIEVAREIDTGRLFRRTAIVASAVLVTLIYWNHHAWIAKLNIERFATTGKLDTGYLVRDLSLNAVPALAAGLASLPEPNRSELRDAIERRYRGRHDMFDLEWYEWNRGRVRARAALQGLGVDLVSSERDRRPVPQAP